jgi:hypothetical protein
MTDVSVLNEGSIFLLTPLSPFARDWFAEHLPDDAQHFGAAVVVEPRYVADILDGMAQDGLALEVA